MMYLFLLVLAAIAVSCLYKEAKSGNDEAETTTSQDVKNDGEWQRAKEVSSSMSPSGKTGVKSFSVKASVVQTLTDMGCQIEEDGDGVYAKYQGEVFYIATSETSRFIVIYDSNWYSVSLDDIDAVARLRRAINYVNGNDVFNIVYSFDEKRWEMQVHTRYTTLWMDEIPYKSDYLSLFLVSMLKLHQTLLDAVEEVKQCETAKKA